MHESFFRGLNTSSRLIAEHYCVHGNTSAAQLRVALSVSFLSPLLSSTLYEKRRQPNLLWILCRDAIMYSQSSRRHLFFLPLFLMYLYTRISLKRACFLLKRPRCSLTDACSAATNFYQRWQETMLVCAKCILDEKRETYELMIEQSHYMYMIKW